MGNLVRRTAAAPAPARAAAIVRPPEPKQPLHIKYRPTAFADVIGQDAVVANLTRLFESERVPHSFLFTGPSGTGKTTFGRIIAKELDCPANAVIEVDAARYSGIDSMRQLLDGAQYAGLGATQRKVYILDEVHAFSKATWQTLLLNVEEPRDHLYFILCTTEPDKVPATIKTRCHAYEMRPVQWEVIADYLQWVAEQEGMVIPADFVAMAARRAEGSVRQALVFLSTLDGIVDKNHALQLVEDAEAMTEGPIVLARMICSGKNFTWPNARKELAQLDIGAESIRLTVLNYAQAVLLKEDDAKRAAYLLTVLNAFSIQCNPSERMSPILLAMGSLLMGN